MTCREVLDFLMSYLDGELPPEVRTAFESHLSMCPSCVAYLNSYRTTIKLGKDAYIEEEAKQNIPQELVQAVLAAARKN